MPSFALAILNQPFHCLRVVMREKQTAAQVKLAYALHVLAVESEVEYVDVLLHALFVDRLWDDNDASLDEVSQCHLGSTFAVLVAYFNQSLVVEEIIAALGKRPPCHDVCPIFPHYLLGDDLLVEYMGFNLVDHRRYFAELCQVDETVGIEVRHTYCT